MNMLKSRTKKDKIKPTPSRPTKAQYKQALSTIRRDQRSKALNLLLREVLPRGDYLNVFEDVRRCFLVVNLTPPKMFDIYVSDADMVVNLSRAIVDPRIKIRFSGAVPAGQMRFVPRQK